MAKLFKWFYPVLSILIFASLAWAMLLESDSIGIGLSAGLLAYSMMLTVVLIAVRPKAIERHIGLTDMYGIHAWMGVVLFLAVILHFINQFNGFVWITEMSIVSQWGYLGALALLVTVLSGVFVLSNTFIKRSGKLMQLKNQKYKRNTHLWLHRLSIVAVIAIWFHMYSLGFLAENSVFMVLMTGLTVITLGWYLLYKTNLARLPKYTLINISKPTPTIYALDLEPPQGEQMDYKAGQYAFLRFVDADVSSEAHPFSFTSAPSTSDDTVQFMIKESGDFTNTLDQLKEGDQVTIEGPYGNFYADHAKDAERPMIFLGGGIGLTPNLSIVRDEVARNTHREIHFIMALAFEEDMMLMDELGAIKSESPNFHYYVIFSNEEVEGYPFGFVTADYLEEIGLAQHYTNADFFICGPPPMMNAAKGILLDNNVDENHIHLEEFAF